MIYLLDTNHDLSDSAGELGVDAASVGQLLTPRTRFTNRKCGPFAIDNGGFSGADPRGFLSLLKREEPNRADCLWVSCPDVPFSAQRTREVFDFWYPRLSGWPVAYVLQNGQENVPIPWDLIACVFVGGDDAFKYGREARSCIRAAQWMGKQTHMGRVNTAEHVKIAEEWGIDSVDGSGIAMYSHMRLAVSDRHAQPAIADLTA